MFYNLGPSHAEGNVLKCLDKAQLRLSYIHVNTSLVCVQSLVSVQIDTVLTHLCVIKGPTADPGVTNLIPARSHTFVKIDCEIILRFFSSFR